MSTSNKLMSGGKILAGNAVVSLLFIVSVAVAYWNPWIGLPMCFVCLTFWIDLIIDAYKWGSS